jgi:hypothetical protein
VCRRVLAATLTFSLCGCADRATAPVVPSGDPQAFAWDLPAGFPTPRIPADNPMSPAVELGRRPSRRTLSESDLPALRATGSRTRSRTLATCPSGLGKCIRATTWADDVAYQPVMIGRIAARAGRQRHSVPMPGELVSGTRATCRAPALVAGYRQLSLSFPTTGIDHPGEPLGLAAFQRPT